MNENIDLTKILKDCPEGYEFYSSYFGKVTFVGISYGRIIVGCPKIHRQVIFNTNGKYVMLTYSDNNDNYLLSDECLLFPSKDQRDWSKFTTPWYKDEKKLIKPKFKVGDKIVSIIIKYMGASGTQGTILKITDDKYIFTDGSRMSISNQDSWELVSDKKPKFDPKTLQPFDKVLVRDSYSCPWSGTFYSYRRENITILKYVTINSFYEYCIPYNDDTKHLVGTTDEAPEYYRYWE